MWYEGAIFTQMKQWPLWCEHIQTVSDFSKLGGKKNQRESAKSPVHILLDM